MKAKKVSVCLIALISVLTIMAYPFGIKYKNKRFFRENFFGLRLCRRRKSDLETNIKGCVGKCRHDRVGRI